MLGEKTLGEEDAREEEGTQESIRGDMLKCKHKKEILEAITGRTFCDDCGAWLK